MADFFTKLLGLNAGEATMDAAGENRMLLSDLLKNGTDLIETGAGGARDALTDASGRISDLLNPIISRGQAGADLYADAMGVNGAEGNTRAMDSFYTSPGYEYRLDQGLDALDRRASAQGRLQSGQSMLDSFDFGERMAGDAFDSWMQGLNGFNSMWTGGVGAEAANIGGLGSDLANLSVNTSSQQLGLEGDIASGFMGANNMYAAGEETNNAAPSELFKSILRPVTQAGGMALGYGKLF